jgi:hypothetical protein
LYSKGQSQSVEPRAVWSKQSIPAGTSLQILNKHGSRLSNKASAPEDGIGTRKTPQHDSEDHDWYTVSGNAVRNANTQFRRNCRVSKQKTILEPWTTGDSGTDFPAELTPSNHLDNFIGVVIAC